GWLPIGSSFSCVDPEVGRLILANRPPLGLFQVQTFGGVDSDESDMLVVPDVRPAARPCHLTHASRALRARAARDVVHFHNGGAAPMPAPVLGAQLRHLRREPETGGYEAAAAADERI